MRYFSNYYKMKLLHTARTTLEGKEKGKDDFKCLLGVNKRWLNPLQ